MTKVFLDSDKKLLATLTSVSEVQSSGILTKISGFSIVKVNQEDEITAIEQDGDSLTLANPIATKGKTALLWLSALLEAVPLRMANILKEAWAGSSNASPSALLKFPLQTGTLILRLSFTQAVDKALDDSTDPQNALSAVETMVSGKILDATRSLLGSLPSVHTRKVKAMLTTLIHQIKQIRSVQEASSIDSPEAARKKWASYLRYAVDASSGKVTVHCGAFTAAFGFVFSSAACLVRTTQTDQAYFKTLNGGGIVFVQGFAGTGKVETQKDLAIDLGYFPIVINCSEDFDQATLDTHLAGVGSDPLSVVIYDEFNRIVRPDVAKSLVSRVMEQKRKGEIAKWLAFTAPSFESSIIGEGAKVVEMSVPDMKDLWTVMLAHEGFEQYEQAAEQMSRFFRWATEKLSKQPIYDFKIRMVKSVLAAATRFLQSGDSETTSLHRAVASVVVPRMTPADTALAEAQLAAQFGGLHRQLAVGLKGDEELSVKLGQFLVLSTLSRGLAVVGPAVDAALASLTAIAPQLDIRLKHLAVTPAAGLFGRVAGDGAWQDGSLSAEFRAAAAAAGGGAARTWLVISGRDLTTEMAENLNPVLDDNRALVLPTGERVGAPDGVAIVLVAESLDEMSPAFLSRFAIVRF